MHCLHCGEVIVSEQRPAGWVHVHLNGHRMCAPTFATPDPHHV